MIPRSLRIDVEIDYKNDESRSCSHRLVSARCEASWLQKPKNKERTKWRSKAQSIAVCWLIPWRGSLAVSALISVQQFHRSVRNTARNSEISAGDWSCIGSELTNYFRSAPRHADAFSWNNATTFFQNHNNFAECCKIKQFDYRLYTEI